MAERKVSDRQGKCSGCGVFINFAMQVRQRNDGRMYHPECWSPSETGRFLKQAGKRVQYGTVGGRLPGRSERLAKS